MSPGSTGLSNIVLLAVRIIFSSVNRRLVGVYVLVTQELVSQSPCLGHAGADPIPSEILGGFPPPVMSRPRISPLTITREGPTWKTLHYLAHWPGNDPQAREQPTGTAQGFGFTGWREGGRRAHHDCHGSGREQ